MPVTLDVTDEMSKKLKPGAILALRDPEGVMLAALHVQELWRPDRLAEAEAVFGTTSKDSSGCLLPARPGKPVVRRGGIVEGIEITSSLRFLPVAFIGAGPDAGRILATWLAKELWLSKRVILCTERIWN